MRHFDGIDDRDCFGRHRHEIRQELNLRLPNGERVLRKTPPFTKLPTPHSPRLRSAKRGPIWISCLFIASAGVVNFLVDLPVEEGALNTHDISLKKPPRP
jgi:hypothetical protein